MTIARTTLRFSTAGLLVIATACSKDAGPASSPTPWTVTANPTAGIDAPYVMAIDSSHMYVAGWETPGSNRAWRIEKRRLLDGSLDPGFGSGGIVTSDPSAGADWTAAIAIDASSMYVLGGDNVSGSDDEWRIEKRSLADGSPIASFGTGGVVTSNPSAGYDQPGALAIDSTHLYAVGSDCLPGASRWRIEKRSLADGSLDTGFGAGGVVTSDPSADWDWGYSVAIDSTSMYVVGVDRSQGSGDVQWRIEKRSLADGSLDAGFGTSGVVVSNPSASADWAYAIAIDAASMYVAGWDRSLAGAYSQWRIEKRSLADGSLDASFGSGGAVGNALAVSPYDSVSAMAMRSGWLYVVGTDYAPGATDTEWRVEKRSTVDGSLDAGFGSGGVFTLNPSAGYDAAYAVASDGTALYVAGIDYGPGASDAQWRIQAIAR